MKYLFTLIFSLFTLACTAQGKPIPHNHNIRAVYLPAAKDSARSMRVDAYNVSRLTLNGTGAGAYKIIRFDCLVYYKAKGTTKLENAAGDRISASMRADLSLTQKGDMFTFTNVIIADASGKLFEADGATYTVN